MKKLSLVLKVVSVLETASRHVLSMVRSIKSMDTKRLLDNKENDKTEVDGAFANSALGVISDATHTSLFVVKMDMASFVKSFVKTLIWNTNLRWRTEHFRKKF